MLPINIKNLILYEDKDILVCHKPCGMAVQSARIGAMDLESALKNYLAIKMPSAGIPYLGIINRLDQPVEGLSLFAKTPSAAEKLTRQMTSGRIVKTYLAVTFHQPADTQGKLVDSLKKEGKTNSSVVVSKDTPGSKQARLSYEYLEKTMDEKENREKYLLRIHLETGRHHQIRVQMANAGMPLAGDRKYNKKESTQLPLGLCSVGLEFMHPSTGKKTKFWITPQSETFSGFGETAKE